MIRSRLSIEVLLIAAVAALAVPASSFAQLDAANAASARAAKVETPPTAPDLNEELRQLALKGKFVLIPISGRIGVDVAPEGFEILAKHRAQFQGATALVIEVDSDSGSSDAAVRITKALLDIGEEVPVIFVIKQAVGPAALLLAAADRTFVPEPSSNNVIVAFQPEIDPIGELSVDESVAHFAETAAALVERSPRREAFESLLAAKQRWSLTARHAYASGIAEPLEGGLAALGRTMRIDPWVSSGRQVEDLLRRHAGHEQQLAVFRARIVARAFASLESASDSIAQMTAAEYAAASLDPRRDASRNGGFRAQPDGDRWTVTPASAASWQRSCESAITAWQRAAAIGDAAQLALQSAEADIGVLVASAMNDATHDSILAEAIDRLEFARAEVESRMAATRARSDRAREEAATIAALLKR